MEYSRKVRTPLRNGPLSNPGYTRPYKTDTFFFIVSVLPASALRKTKVVRNATIRLLHAVSPVPLRTVFGGPPGFKNAPAGAFSFLASVSKKYLANSARFAVTKRIAAVCFPLKTRTVLYATKVAPMVGAYVVRREIITRTSEKGSVNRDLKWEKTHVWGSEKIKTIVLEHGGFFTKVRLGVSQIQAHCLPIQD